MKSKRYSFSKIDKSKKKESLKPLFKRQALVIGLSVFLILVITLATSVAIFTKTGEGSEYNVVQVGDLELSYVDLNDEGNVLELADSYPLSDSEGEVSTPYRFSVENTGTIIANYTVKILQDIDTINADGCSDNLLDYSYLRYKFDNETSGNLKDKIDASNEYVVGNGTLEPGESNIHEIRLWINESSPNSVLGTHYHGKVVIDVEQDNTTNPNERPFVSTLEEKVDTATTINFAEISSATNGRGIYKYTEDGKDIYYWRGAVTDNHVIFGGYCWEMVRTTKTGGIKMIYDGVPVVTNGVKTCPNTDTASQLEKASSFNSLTNDNAYVGYMYGLTGVTVEPSTPQCIKLNSAGTAAEVGTETTEETCIQAGGKWATTAYQSTHANIVNSTIKGAIDTWFSTSSLNTEENLEKIEDTVYCNDRSIDTVSAYGTELGYGTNQTAYMARYRLYTTTERIPSLECANVNDRFTTSKENGNGDLTYPVGLLTADEISLAGGVNGSVNNDYYLYTGRSYWALSPLYIDNSAALEFRVSNDGDLGYHYVDREREMRPVISLAAGTTFMSGTDGTESNPYVVK